MSEALDRRDFLKVAAGAAAAALSACSAPQTNKLIPYLVPAEEVVPGVSTWYKSVCRECPAGCGVLVRTREARALKVEGNPDHPVNRGRLCIRGQASVQGLYNPDRIAQPLRRTPEGKLEPISWPEAEELLANLLRYLRFEKQADRVALISHRVTGSLEGLFRDWMRAYGSPRFYQYEPIAYEALSAANRIAFGTSEIPQYDLRRANVLLSFGADFLETWISNVGYAVDFATMRRVEDGRAALFIHVEPRLSLTAANADEWISPRPDTEVFLVLAMIREILARGWARNLAAGDAARIRALVEPYDAERVASVIDIPAERIRSLAKTFANARPGLALGGGVGVTGKNSTATLVALNLLNYVSGNVGETIHFGRGTNFDPVATYRQMLDLADAMRRDQVLLLLLHHVNPAWTMPAAAAFREALDRIPFKVSFASFMDETTALADLILPDHTPLERWEDYSPRAGVYGIAQPSMRPLFSTKASGDVLLSLTQKLGGDLAAKFPQKEFFEYLKDSWKPLHRQFAPQKDFEEFWQQAVESGGVWHDVPARPARLVDSLTRFSFPALGTAGKTALQLAVYPSLHLFDGRGANRPWLQEVPEPLSKIVWDSWVEIHRETARERGIAEGDLVELRTPAGTVQAPAHLSDGIRRDTLAIPLGQGHTALGRYAENRGVNPLRLLPNEVEPASGGLVWSGTTVEISKLAVNRPLVRTQEVFEQHNRDVAQVISLAQLLEASRKNEAPEKTEPALRMYAPHPHPEHRWGMAIDLDACIGCNACIAACYAENNVPVVGKEQVSRGRHMAWIRIDRYVEPAAAGLETRFEPMLCQQCDSAPCESVCPVYATYHNPEGLNVQVYNRCVGTRYCGNNCPYKVRRFNWFDTEWPWPLALQLNPDLSVRTKGVMEKCTFCLQRIRAGKDLAKDEGRPVRDGEITPACAQTCPTEAIVFGDLKDPNSRVSRLRRNLRAYRVLEELNTEPAITCLKKIMRKV